jgi:hypothetical protein
MKAEKAQEFEFVKPCPVSDRHGYLQVVRNESGGLIAICIKCYVPVKGRKDLREECTK